MKTIYFIKLIFISALIFAGCTSIKIPGEYVSKSGSHLLSLKEDSTFSYYYKFEFTQERSNGVFSSANSNSIVLNSNIRDKELPLSIKENPNCDSSNNNILFINFNIPKNESRYYLCEVFKNGVSYKKVYCDSLSSLIIKEPLRSFFFKISTDSRMPGRFLDVLYTEEYETRSERGNNLTVDILYTDSLFNYHVFNNIVLKKVSKKTLALKDPNGKIAFKVKK